MQVEFNIEKSHHCTSHVDGDWIIWRCPICIGYERRLIVVTGKMAVKGKTEFQHQGSNNGKNDINEPLIKNICQN